MPRRSKTAAALVAVISTMLFGYSILGSPDTNSFLLLLSRTPKNNNPTKDIQMPIISTNSTAQLRQQPPDGPRIILIWNKFFEGKAPWPLRLYNNLSSLYTPEKVYGYRGLKCIGPDCKGRCTVTDKKSVIQQASAVVFHGMPFDFWASGMPDIRYSWQRWVMVLHESPQINGWLNDRFYKGFDKLRFNLTMTYRRHVATNVFYGWGEFYKRQLEEPARQQLTETIQKWVTGFGKRPLDAVWAVNNCDSQGRRQDYIKALQKHGISVTVFGKCGLGRLEENWPKYGGVHPFFDRFRFFLAFENSICDDYMSEKAYIGAYHNIFHGLVPIVYGGANYSDLLPQGSYLNAMEMSPKEMAETMANLSKPEGAEKLATFYKWQYSEDMEMILNDEEYYQDTLVDHVYGPHELCHRIWQQPKEPEVVTDLKGALGSCRYPPVWN